MKKLRLLKNILRVTGIRKIIVTFIIFYFLCSFIFVFVEPTVKSYGEALWYSFSVLSTAGFGDFVATNAISRAFSILLGVFGIFVAALIPGILVNFYSEILKAKSKESLSMLFDKLEILPELPKEELEKISDEVKRIRNQSTGSLD